MRVCKLKDKFHCLINQNSEKKTVLRELSSCVIKKFNCFYIVCIEFIKKPLRSIDIIYKPVKKCDNIVNCLFSKKLNLAFRVSYSEGQRTKCSTAWQCYFCLNYYTQQDKFDGHVENSTGHPGYVYNFNTQNLLTFEGDVPLVAYVDFETTASTDQQ